MSKNEEDNQNRLTYTDDVIKDRLGRYGAVFFPSDVRETIDDIIGNERQKERLEDLFNSKFNYSPLWTSGHWKNHSYKSICQSI